MDIKICEEHRKELLRFLLLKTAGVRCGVKPGELLRVRHCYRGHNAEGFSFCLYRRDILNILQLQYVELRVEAASSLVLFYHPARLRATLADVANRAILRYCGYPAGAALTPLIDFLQQRFQRQTIPHEVGVFLGYPAKDVAGFMAARPRTPVARAAWAVFGDARTSLRRMGTYRRMEEIARGILDTCEDLPTFFTRLATINSTERSVTNG